MIVKYSPAFLKITKKVDVRIRKSLKERIAIFIKNPGDLWLNNHALQGEYLGYRSIDITGDWRAIYKETVADDEIFAYFVALGTHKELYRKRRTS